MSKTETFRHLSEQKSAALSAPLREALAQTRASNQETQARIAVLPILLEKKLLPVIGALQQVEEGMCTQKKAERQTDQKLHSLAKAQLKMLKDQSALKSRLDKSATETKAARRALRVVLGALVVGHLATLGTVLVILAGVS